MFDLDNLDLELDEDFPSGPLNNSDLFESSFSGSLPWSQGKSKGNDTLNTTPSCKNIQELLKIRAASPNNSGSTIQTLAGVKSRTTADSWNIGDNLNKSVLSKNLFDENENSDSKDISSGKRIQTQRKFPGPAGILPDKPLSDLNIIIDNHFENISAERQKESVILCSQTSSVFVEPSFQKLLSDFDMKDDRSPFNKYTIDWVKKGAMKKTLFGRKIPFLAVILHHLDHNTPDPVLTLRDSTGEIYGTLHREVWAELGPKLQPGAALALRQVGVLITGIARRQIYLNITINNIVNIYCYSDDEVETNQINEVNKNDIIKSIEEWQRSVTPNTEKGATPNKEQSVVSQLFCTIGNEKLGFSRKSINSNTDMNSHCLNNDFSSLSKNEKTLSVEQKHGAGPSSINNNSTHLITKNFFTAMEDDDMSDFLASLDDTDLSEKNEIQYNDACKLKKKDIHDNVKKRKINGNDITSTVKKSQCIYPNNEYKENSRVMNFKTGNEGKKFLSSQPLSQAESQLVEEALDGINFDDF